MRPSVSSARIKEILGATYLSVKVQFESVGAQIFLRKWVWLSHDSSTLMILLFFSSSGRIFIEYYCLNTRHLSLLLWIGTCLANL